MPKKQPYFPWYAGDWLSDEGVRACSLEARGLWADLLSLMHKCDRRGYLQLHGKPVTHEQLARMTGCSSEQVSRLVAELLNSGVASALDDGTIFSRRMVRDEAKRQKCSDAGKLGGGNPNLKGMGATYKGGCKGGVKGGSKPGLKRASDIWSSSDESEKEEEDLSGEGGLGEGATYKGESKGGVKGRTNGRAVDALNPDFDRFWRQYPRKQRVQKARIAWDSLDPDPALVETILAAVAKQLRSKQWMDGFAPNAHDWLAECRWTDELPAEGSSETALEALIEQARREQCRNPEPTG